MTKGLTIFTFTFIILINIIGTHLAAASAKDSTSSSPQKIHNTFDSLMQI